MQVAIDDVWHLPGVLQTLEQVPQWVGSELTCVSHPLAGFESQSAHPEVHELAPGIVHEYTLPDRVHASVTLFVLHAPPAAAQAPQLAGVVSSVSHPFFGFPSQSACVGSVHTTWEQTPPTQCSIAPPAVLQAFWLPHPPQLLTSVRMSTSHPSDATWLQSMKPAVHVFTEHA